MIRSLATIGLTLILAAVIAPALNGQTLLNPVAEFDGFYRPSGWVTYRITVNNPNEEFKGTLQIRGVGETIFDQDLHLPAPTQRKFEVPVLIHGQIPTLEAHVVDPKGASIAKVLLPRPRPLGRNDRLAGVLCLKAHRYELDPQRFLPGGRIQSAFLAPGDLAVRADRYSNFDVLILHDLPFNQLNLQRLKALMLWTRAGGHLVLTNWELLYGPKGTPLLRELFPRFRDSRDSDPQVILEKWGRLNPTVEACHALGIAPEDAVLVEGNSLLYFRKPLDRGTVTVLGLPPTREPMKAWSFEKKQRLWQSLLTPDSAAAEGEKVERRGMNCVSSEAFAPFLPSSWPEEQFRSTGLLLVVYGGAVLAVFIFLHLFVLRWPFFAALALLAGITGGIVLDKGVLPDRSTTSHSLTFVTFRNRRPETRIVKTLHLSSMAEEPITFVSQEREPLYPLAYNLHLLNSTSMHFSTEGDRNRVHALTLPRNVRFCFQSVSRKDNLGSLGITFEPGEVPKARVLSELKFPLRDAMLLRRGVSYPLGRLAPGDGKTVLLSPAVGTPIGTVLHHMDQTRQDTERRILTAFTENHLSPGETVLLGFADELETWSLSSDTFLHRQAYPTLVSVTLR